MKDFDQLQHLWRQQTITIQAEPRKLRAVQSSATRIVNSRRRLLRLGVAVTIFSLFIGQLLTVLNTVHGDRTPSTVALVHFGVMQVFQIGLLIVLLRRLRAHRERRARSAASVRDNFSTSLALIEDEMRDYRIGLRLFAVLLFFDLVPVLNGYQQGYFDGTWAVRSLVVILLIGLTLFIVAWRHYRQVLQPQRQRLTDVLHDMEAE